MTIDKVLVSLSLTLLTLAFLPNAQALQAVPQRGYDAGVSGANLAETTLSASNVGPSTFGLAFKLRVDDNVFAQPLYVPNVAIPSLGNHNVVYVATMSDKLYAFDADVGGAPLWVADFAGRLGATPVPYASFAFSGNRNVVGNLGILSTPVIDTSSGIMYLVTCTLEANSMTYRLHAVDIATGAEPFGTGALISGSHGGSTFQARYQTQRVSLTLSGKQVVFGFAAIEQEYPGGYTGWVFAYDKQTLKQSGVFATVTTGSRGGGVWQSGRPPAVDSAGYVYVFVGNGYTGGYDGVKNFSESALKLDPANGLKLIDWFTPGNFAYLDTNDLDISSSGPMLIPGTSLLAGGGKAGDFYVLNTASLGKFSSSDSQIVQKLHISVWEIIGGPVYWPRSSANGGSLMYNWSAGEWVKAYSFGGAKFATAPTYQGSGTYFFPGGILALSANGEQRGSGVLWATTASTANAENNPPAPGVLHAFDAGNISDELWNSTMNKARDDFGNLAKYVPPLVINGKVYVATSSNQVAVYGLFTSYTVSSASLAFGKEQVGVASAPLPVTVKNAGAVPLPINSIALSTSGSQPFSQTNTCGTSIAVGGNCIINVTFDPASAGANSATLSINAGNGAGTKTVALSGAGVVPTYTVTPASVMFGNQSTNVASAPIALTLTNTGTIALPISGISLSTPGSQPFAQTNTCGASVAAGANCTINVVFNPASPGAASATLSVNGGSGASTRTVTLSGTGIISSYSVSPGSVAFGNQITNLASAPVIVTLTNTGTVPLPVNSIALSTAGNSPFSQTNTCDASLAIGANCIIGVVFEPASPGPATATLTISAGISTAPTTIAMSGTGIELSYTLSPTSVTFGDQMTNTASAPTAVTLTNTGTVALPIDSIAVSTHGAQPFSQTNDCGTRLPLGASCKINVVFNPAAVGPNSAALDVSAGQIPASVTLSGKGNFDIALTAGAGSVTAGVPVTLTWSSTPGASCAAAGGADGDNWSGMFGDSGTRTVTEPKAGNFNYSLNCTADGMNATAAVGVSFTVPTVTMSAAPTSVTIGKSVTLSWNSSNATSCAAGGGQTGDGWSGTQPTNGTASVTPKTSGTITYAIVCSADSQSAQSQAQITATDPPSSGGGGAIDTISLLSLLTMTGLRERALRKPRDHRSG